MEAKTKEEWLKEGGTLADETVIRSVETLACYGEALASFERAIGLEPSAYAYESKGDALQALGRDG